MSTKPKQKVGFMYPVWAPLNSHTDGSMPTYGTGRVLFEGRTATETFEFANNPDYGDDRVVADDNSPTGMTMSFEPTGMSDEDRVAVLGEEENANTTTGGQWTSDKPSPWGGMGYIDKFLGDDAKTYQWKATITLCIHFREESRNHATKEGGITWGHPTFNGRAKPLDVDGSGALRYQLHKTFDTIAAAKSWINGILNVSASQTT